MSCPYCFINEFEKWWLWNLLVIYRGVSEYGATQHVETVSSGWKVCDGWITGMYMPDRSHPSWKERRFG